MTLTGKVAPYKQNFGPYAPEVYQVPYPYEYRRPAGMAAESLGGACVEAVRQLFKTTVSADRVAGILVEPVQGEGGFVVPPPDFLPGLRALCSEYQIPLIADEVQTGFGRTGRMFAVEHSGIEPDLIVLAKSMGGGLPLGAVVGRSELMDATNPGGLGGTFGGNPVACAAALAVIDVLLEEKLPERGKRLGDRRRPLVDDDGCPEAPVASQTLDVHETALAAFSCGSSTLSAQSSPVTAFINGVRTGSHLGYDRVVIQFGNGQPSSVSLQPQTGTTFTNSPRGDAVTLSGHAGLRVLIRGADAHTSYAGPYDFKTNGPALMELRRLEDFEGQVQWGLGLARSACHRSFILTNPTRLVIDIQGA